jgi:hypothetical protein
VALDQHNDNLLVMTLPLTKLGRVWLILLIAMAGVFAVVVLPPLKQPQKYHQFADQRSLLGIPNILNVISNGGFLLVGLMGLSFLLEKRAMGADTSFIEPFERLPYAVFFFGVVFTCFGSAYYHWKPNDSTLVWDRLPMTVAFMSILAAMIAERIDVKVGLRLLWPLVLTGVASVWYWRWSGNLWPYAAAQYFSILLVGLIIVLFPPRYSRSSDLLWVVALYVLAKLAEALDARIWGATRFISGHTLKHLVAALAVYWVLRMLVKRSGYRNEAWSALSQKVKTRGL